MDRGHKPPPGSCRGVNHTDQHPRRYAIEPKRELLLHLHGVSAEDLAAILARVNRDHG
jgi:hypothetical protein